MDRICIKCGEAKSLIDFPKNNRQRRNVCKDCFNKYRREKYAKAVSKQRDNVNKKIDIVTKFLSACDYDFNLIDEVPKDKFIRCYHIEESIDYEKVKEEARVKLGELGYLNPAHKLFTEEGNYLIIGDTFGKKTNSEKFKLLRTIADKKDVNAVIVIGHNTDDYADVSNAFALFNCPVYILPIKNELKDVHTFAQEYEHINVILDYIKIGDILVKNQDYITPYVKTSLSRIDPLLYPGKCIVNCTRHEYFTRNTTFEPSFICSPGAMAEPHVERIQYKLTLSNGARMNVTPCNRDSFLKYRKNEIDKTLWEMGCIVVNIDEDNQTSVEMIRIKSEDDIYYTVLPDGTYINNKAEYECLPPSHLILADIHAPFYTEECIMRICKTLQYNRPQKIIINGDLLDCRSVNPHDEYEAMQYDFKQEVDSTQNLLKHLYKKLSKNIYTMMGNHEEFLNRWLKHAPQLTSFIKEVLYEKFSKYSSMITYNHNDIHIFDDIVKVIHGSNKIFGQSGSKIEQIARSIGTDCVMGHTHSPQIRFGVYCAGCLCDYDQRYNNSTTSNWQHGYILAYTTKHNTVIYHQILL